MLIDLRDLLLTFSEATDGVALLCRGVEPDDDGGVGRAAAETVGEAAAAVDVIHETVRVEPLQVRTVGRGRRPLERDRP